MVKYHYEMWNAVETYSWREVEHLISSSQVVDYCISGKDSYETSPLGLNSNAEGFIRPAGNNVEYCPTAGGTMRYRNTYETFSSNRIRRRYITNYAANGNLILKVTDIELVRGFQGYDKGNTLVDTIIADDGLYPDNGYASNGANIRWFVKKGPVNTAPTTTLNTPNNATLHENDTYTVSGSAKDANNGDVVSVWYQINNDAVRAIESKVSDGTTPIGYALQLTFKAGKLQTENGTAVTGALVEGTAHKLKVWSEDNKGSKSEIIERTFYVVPNRPPSLTVNPFPGQSGLIKSDELEVSGTTNDPDGNDVKVAYRLNGGAPVEVHNGPAGAWSFKILLSRLKDGENTVIVEVIDTYNVKVSETFKLDKSVNRTPIAASVQRYQIIPAAESAKSVRFWVRRDPGQVLTAEISMTNGDDPEQFVVMQLGESILAENGLWVEDEFNYTADDPAEKIMLKLNMANDKPVNSITGVLT